MKKYFWDLLEPSYNVYDFSSIRNDLANLAAIGKQLVITIQAETFNTNDKRVPAYLLDPVVYDGGVYLIDTGTGYNLAYYNVNVQNRMIALINALAVEFDQHTNLEAINFEETSPSKVDPTWNNLYITDYINGMLRIAQAAKAAFLSTVIIQYVNYPESSLAHIISTLQASGIGMGGPDTYATNASLAAGIYSYHPALSGVLPIGMQVDYNDYESSTGGGGPVNLPSIASIHAFAVASLKPNYMFWLRRTYEAGTGYNFWQDVLNYFGAYNWATNPTGGMISTRPTSIGNP
jgi:hypothetical protein